MAGPKTGRQVHGHEADITRSNSTALGGAATTATGVARGDTRQGKASMARGKGRETRRESKTSRGVDVVIRHVGVDIDGDDGQRDDTRVAGGCGGAIGPAQSDRVAAGLLV